MILHTVALFAPSKTVLKYDEDRLCFIRDMRGITLKATKYKIGYSFSLKDSSFFIEFYDKDCKKYDDVIPLHLLKKYKEIDYHSVMSNGMRLKKSCLSCKRYECFSNSFLLDYNSCILDFHLSNECFGLSIPFENEFNIICLSNNIEKQSSQIYVIKSDDELDAELDKTIPMEGIYINLSLIPFVSKEETARRINNLIIFS